MNCTICGKGTSHGALLCRPCKAALKRARLLTVQELPHYAPAAEGNVVVYGAETGPSERTKARRRSEKIDHGGRLLLSAVGAIALVVAAYLAERELTARAATPPSPPALVARDPDPASFNGAAPRDATIAPGPTLDEMARPTPVAPRQKAPVGSPVWTASAMPATTPAQSLRDASETRRQDSAIAPPAVYPPLDSFGPLAEAPKPAPPVVAAAPRVSPPPDRWQVMRDALGRCANEGGLSGFICDQRVRLASCDGYWGRVAQCPNPPENPR